MIAHFSSGATLPCITDVSNASPHSCNLVTICGDIFWVKKPCVTSTDNATSTAYICGVQSARCLDIQPQLCPHEYGHQILRLLPLIGDPLGPLAQPIFFFITHPPASTKLSALALAVCCWRLSLLVCSTNLIVRLKGLISTPK